MAAKSKILKTGKLWMKVVVNKLDHKKSADFIGEDCKE